MHGNEIRAVYTQKTIRIYQAYSNDIASEAVKLGTFGSKFKMDRMTWIKPSFLWMMYRCGWGTKENSEIRCQWDPERDIFGNPLDYRSIQIGIRGEALKKYVNEWIVSLTDITEYVDALRKKKEMGRDITELLPDEKTYKFLIEM